MTTAHWPRRIFALTAFLAGAGLSCPAGAQSAAASGARPKPSAPAVSPEGQAVHPGASPTLPADAPASSASSASGAAEPGEKERARTLYAKGAKAYAEARYHEAADFFLDANRIYPTPQLSFNIGKAYDKAGYGAGALRFYRDYLRNVPDAPDRVEVSERIRALELSLMERGLQQLSIGSTPAGATVLLDGRPVGVTPWTGETWPGRHRVQLELPGHVKSDDLVELDAHRAAEAQIPLSLAPPPQAREPRAPVRAQRDAHVRPLTWVALGVGVLALGTGLTLEMADGRQGGLSPGAAFCSGLGVAGAALGGVMLYIDMNALSQ